MDDTIAAAERLRRCQAEYAALKAAAAEQLQKRAERYARLEAGLQTEIARLHAALAASPPTPGPLALVAAQQGEIERLRQQVAGLEHRLQTVLGSLSWHVTGPLRGFTQRHPDLARHVARVLRAPRGRAALRRLRAVWRVVTLRHQPAAPPPPGPVTPKPVAPDLAPPALEAPAPAVRLAFAPITPAGPAPAPVLTARGGRRAVCVTHVLPFPPRAGNAYRIHRLLLWLAAEGWDVLLVVCPLPHDQSSPAQIAAAAAVYPNLLVLDRNGTVRHRLRDTTLLRPQPQTWRGKLAQLHAAEDARRGRALNLQRQFCPDALVALLLHVEQEFAPDLVLAEYAFMTRPFPLLGPAVLKAVDTHDVFSHKAEKLGRFDLDDGLALLPDEEAALLQHAELVVAIQPEEARALRLLAPAAGVVCVGVDCPVPDADAPPGRTILLVASANPMNVKGAADFLRFAWPIIRRAAPETELVVAGSAAGALPDLADCVRAVGPVDALGPLYAEARLVINPAVAGTGLKVKTIEAICHLRPVVCWPTGAEGVPDELRRFCAVATDWSGFARLVIDQLRDQSAGAAMVRARGEIARAFSAETVYAPLRDALVRA